MFGEEAIEVKTSHWEDYTHSHAPVAPPLTMSSKTVALIRFAKHWLRFSTGHVQLNCGSSLRFSKQWFRFATGHIWLCSNLQKVAQICYWPCPAKLWLRFATIIIAGGIITSSDLENYEVTEREPLVVPLAGLDFYLPPPPGSGAVLALILNILEGLILFYSVRFTQKGDKNIPNCSV